MHRKVAGWAPGQGTGCRFGPWLAHGRSSLCLSHLDVSPSHKYELGVSRMAFLKARSLECSFCKKVAGPHKSGCSPFCVSSWDFQEVWRLERLFQKALNAFSSDFSQSFLRSLSNRAAMHRSRCWEQKIQAA